jgi:hypothetical protein
MLLHLYERNEQMSRHLAGLPRVVDLARRLGVLPAQVAARQEGVSDDHYVPNSELSSVYSKYMDWMPRCDWADFAGENDEDSNLSQDPRDGCYGRQVSRVELSHLTLLCADG